MPAYDYKCTDCNENFTFEKSMTDETTPNCPKCNSLNVKRVWGGIQFKGLSSGSGSSGKSCGPCSGGSCSSCHS